MGIHQPGLKRRIHLHDCRMETFFCSVFSGEHLLPRCSKRLMFLNVYRIWPLFIARGRVYPRCVELLTNYKPEHFWKVWLILACYILWIEYIRLDFMNWIWTTNFYSLLIAFASPRWPWSTAAWKAQPVITDSSVTIVVSQSFTILYYYSLCAALYSNISCSDV